MGAPPDNPPGSPPAPPAGAGGKGSASQAKRLGRFSLVQEMASGGMATLYLARAAGPAGFEKLVAIKRIHPHLSKQRYFVEMFLDEARIAARIQHPNVVQIYELGEVDGDYFIAMEYIEGESLARLAAQARKIQKQTGGVSLLPIAEAAAIVAEAATGLHAAHELRSGDGSLLGLVHRDVSPHNILITYDGHVKLVDFGVAKARGRMTQTVGGQLKGKIAYMSPEQVQGHEIDRRSDIFSLGIVLFEVTCSRRLFKDKSEVGSIQRIMSGKVPPPSKVVPGYPTMLEMVVMRALASDPAERFQTANDMARAIHQAVASMGSTISSVELGMVMQETFPDRIEMKAQLRKAGESSGPTQAEVLKEVSSSQTLEFSPSSGHSVTGSEGTAAMVHSIKVRQRRPWLMALGAFVLTAVATLSTYPFLKQRFAPDDVGTLRIVSDPPGAQVFRDRKGPLSRTPALLNDVPLGEHLIAVRLDGHEVWERQLTLDKPGQEIILEAVLRPTAGPPSTDAGEAAAADGGAHPDAGQRASPDASALASSKPDAGKKRRPGKRRPKQDETGPPGMLTLRTVPWAEVWLGKKRIGETPLIGVKLPPGQHTLKLLPEGKKPARSLKIKIRSERHVRRELSLR